MASLSRFRASLGTCPDPDMAWLDPDTWLLAPAAAEAKPAAREYDFFLNGMRPANKK